MDERVIMYNGSAVLLHDSITCGSVSTSLERRSILPPNLSLGAAKEFREVSSDTESGEARLCRGTARKWGFGGLEVTIGGRARNTSGLTSSLEDWDEFDCNSMSTFRVGRILELLQNDVKKYIANRFIVNCRVILLGERMPE